MHSRPPGGPGVQDALSRFIAIRWDDPATSRLTIRPELINDVGLLLGPVAFSLVDYAMGSALWQQTTDDEHIATTNISINFVQSARTGDVVCNATVDRRNRRAAVLSARLRHDDGRLLATAIGSFSIFPRRDG